MVTKNTGYLSLNKDCSLKILEYPSIFNKKTNELFKINETALDFIKNNQNIKVDEIENNEFIDQEDGKIIKNMQLIEKLPQI